MHIFSRKYPSKKTLEYVVVGWQLPVIILVSYVWGSNQPQSVLPNVYVGAKVELTENIEDRKTRVQRHMMFMWKILEREKTIGAHRLWTVTLYIRGYKETRRQQPRACLCLIDDYNIVTSNSHTLSQHSLVTETTTHYIFYNNDDHT